MTEGRLTFRDRVGIALWWLIFVGFPVSLVTLIAAIVANLSDYEVKRLCTAAGAICGAIGFIYGRKLSGLPWAKNT